MAHFAKIENGTVKNCIVVKNIDCGGGEFPESEPIGQKFISSLGFDGEWKQTSYNKNFRGQFAGVGSFYNSELDCFHGACKFESWILKKDGLWYPPIEKPVDEFEYNWNEETKSWDKIDN